MYLTHQQFTIRNATKEDAKQLCIWWNDGNVMAHAGFPLGLNTTEEEIIEKLKADTDDTRRRLIIEVNDKAVGEMSYSNVGHQTAEIGIKICDTTHQNKGQGKIFLSLLIKGLFDAGFQKIILDTNLNNLRAQHVYEQLGFQKLRINHDSWVDQLGKLQSSVDYMLTVDKFVDFLL